MASKLVLLLAITATLGVSFGCLADATSLPGGSSGPDPSLSLAAAVEFALPAHAVLLGAAPVALAGIPVWFGEADGSTAGLSRPPLYPSRR